MTSITIAKGDAKDTQAASYASQIPVSITECKGRAYRLIPAGEYSGTVQKPPGVLGFWEKTRNTTGMLCDIFTGNSIAMRALSHMQPPSLDNKIVYIPKLFFFDTWIRTILIILDVDMVAAFLTEPREGGLNISGGRPWRLVGQEVGTHSLLTDNVDLHSKLRKFIIPHLTPSALKNFFPEFLAHAKTSLAAWKSQGQPINITAEMAAFACSSTVQVLFGAKDKTIHPEAVEIISEKLGYKMLHMPEFVLSWLYYKKFENAHRQIEDLIDDLIGNPTPSRLLEAMKKQLEEEQLTIEYFRDMCKLLLFAGQETTSSLLSTCFFLLAQDPDRQREIRNEMIERGITIETLSSEDLLNLVQLRDFVNQALHEHPPIWGQTRFPLRDLVLTDDEEAYAIPKGVGVILWLEQLGREGTNGQPQVFGSGKNSCPGRHFAVFEAKVLLASVLLEHEIKPVDEQQPKFVSLSTHHIQGSYGVNLNAAW